MQAYASSIQIDVPGVQLLDVAAVIDDDLTHEQWIHALGVLGRLAVRSAWWLGDAFIQGQGRWGGKYAKMAAAEAGVKPSTIVDYASVSRSVPPSVRRSDLSHAHHRLVAAIRDPEEQARLLAYAAQNDLTVAEFRRELGRAPVPPPQRGGATFTADNLADEPSVCPKCKLPVPR